MQPDKARERVRSAIRHKFGVVDASTLRRFASISGLSYTTLARYLIYEPPRIDFPRNTTFEKIGQSLNINPVWLREGVGDQQLPIWPLVIQASIDPSASSPTHELERAIEALSAVSPRARLLAARAAIASAIQEIVGVFEPVPPSLYRSLLQLDAMHREEPALIRKEA